MSESPPDGGGPKAGDEGEGGTRKKGESDPLFNPPGLKRRTTVMGLAPAPHLGGLSGSPGAIARAEAEARKQRVLTRITPSPGQSKRPMPPAGLDTGPPPPTSLREEIIEPLPPPFSAAPPPPVEAVGVAKPKPGSGTYVGMGPTGKAGAPAPQTVMMSPNVPTRERRDIQDASIITDAPADVPNRGQSTMLIMPATPGVPLTLPQEPQKSQSPLPPKPGSNPPVGVAAATARPGSQPDVRPGSRPDLDQPKLPDSAGWEVVAVQPPPNEGPGPAKKDSSPGFPSAGTVLIEPARMKQQASQQAAAAQKPPAQQQQQTVLHLGAAAQQAQQQAAAVAAQRAAQQQPGQGPQQQGLPPHQQWAAAQQHTAPHQQQVRPQTVAIPQQRPQPVEAPPNTERMMRVAQQQGLAAPPAALALRQWEPGGGSGAESERNLGERHSLSGTLDRRLILWSEPDSARASSYRSLRDSLVGKGLPRVVAVSSASFLNGTTTCAVNLALALTELPQTRVLLLDANFYEPALATVFTLDRLTQIAPKEPWLKPYTIVSASQSLHVAGIARADVTGRMEPQQRFESLIDRLCRANYDYIIVDTPALKGSAVVSLVSACDGCILAVRAGSTTARDLRRAADQLPPKKALGVALVDGGER